MFPFPLVVYIFIYIFFVFSEHLSVPCARSGFVMSNCSLHRRNFPRVQSLVSFRFVLGKPSAAFDRFANNGSRRAPFRRQLRRPLVQKIEKASGGG